MHLLTPSLKLNDGFQCVRTKYILLHLALLVYQKLVTELCAGDTIQRDHRYRDGAIGGVEERHPIYLGGLRTHEVPNALRLPPQVNTAQ